LAFDYIIDIINAPKNSTFLDAGCGTLAPHSIRLAKHGYFVEAVDFSASALKTAETNIKSQGMESRIKLKQESITSLSYDDESFDYILCWGVLMHIPELEKAISELSRILREKGLLVLSETNLYSLQAVTNGLLKRIKSFLGKQSLELRVRQAGIEFWKNTISGQIVTRETNMRWLVNELKMNGLVLKKRTAGQFTELYIRVHSLFLKMLIHWFNSVWFKYIKIPNPAFGNILFFQKSGK
jgi:ubiquinone/menaquinone biosynthesis C-methylase UbiE